MSNREEPPTVADPPECCDEIMDILDDGSCQCIICARLLRFDEPPQVYEDFFPGELHTLDVCPHGKEWGACTTCLHEKGDAQ